MAAALLPADAPRARQFFCCALALGFAYAVINPPFAVNDERSHLLRAYEIARGQMVTKSRPEGPYHVIPLEYRGAIRTYANVQRKADARIDPWLIYEGLVTPEDFEKTVEYDSGAAEYSPIPYLPELPALWLAIKLRLPTLWHIYLARFAGVLCFSLLGSWSVAVSRKLAWIPFALGLAPMALTQAAGLSVDGVTNGLSMLFFALVARGALLEREASRRDQRALLWLLGLLVACKPIALSFVLALPALRPAGKPSWRFCAQALAVGSLTLLLWALLDRAFLRTGVVAPALEQMAWMWANPGATLRAWSGSLFTQGDDYLIQLLAFRDLLSRQLRFAGGTVVVLYGGLLVLLALGAAWRSEQAQPAQRVVALYLLLVVATFAAITWFGVYTILSAAGAGQVYGMQGRYLIPTAPALLFALAALGPPRAARWLGAAPALRIIAPIVAINVWCLSCLIGRYYLPTHVGWPY